MRRYKVLQTGDWHNDAESRRWVEPAITFLADQVEARKPDLVVFCGDAYVHRGAVRPHGIAFNRMAMRRMGAAATYGLAAISGNHDQEFREGLADALTATITDDSMGVGANCVTTAIPNVLRIGGPGAGNYDLESNPLSLVMVPTVNKYWLHALAQNLGVEQIEPAQIAATVEDAIRGMVLAEIEAGHQPIVVYHGTVGGAVLSNEQVMHAGIDVPLSSSVFEGAAAGLLGHIHHPQVLLAGADKVPLFYTGSIAPLTWNDALLEPRAYLHTFEVDGPITRLVETETIAIPVASQMVEVTIPPEAWEGFEVRQVINARLLESPASAGDRVRLRIKAPSAIVHQVNNRLIAELCAEFSFAALTPIKEASDLREVRFVAERTIDMLDAFRRWSELQGLPAQEAAAMVDYAQGIETQITGENVDAHFEFLPVKLTVDNWYQHAHAEIDFADVGPLVSVSGPNTSGKSNLLRAVLFALYKEVLAGDVLADVVRSGQTSASVALDFNSHDRIFRIRRAVKVAASGNATAALFFEENVGGEWTPRAAGTAGETELEIQKLVGPLGLFLATSYAGQSDADSLLDLGPSRFRDLLQTVLQRDFQSRAKIARKDAGDAVKAAGEASAARAVYQSQAVDVEDLDRQIRGRQAIVEGLEASVAVDREPDLIANHAEVQSQVEDLVGLVAAGTAAAERADRARRELEQSEQRLAQKQEAAFGAGRGEADLVAKLAEVEDLDVAAAQAAMDAAEARGREARADYDAALADRRGDALKADLAREKTALAVCQAAAHGEDQLAEQIAALKAVDLTAAEDAARAAGRDENALVALAEKRRADPARDQVAGELSTARIELAAVQSQVAGLRQEVDRDTRDAALVQTVPCKGGSWLPPDDDVLVDMDGCRFLKAAAAAAVGLPEKTARLTTAATRAAALDDQVAQLAARLAAAAADHNRQMAILAQRLDAARAARVLADQALAQATAAGPQRAALEAAWTASREAARKAATHAGVIVILEQGLADLQAEHEALLRGLRERVEAASAERDLAVRTFNRAQNTAGARAALQAALDACRLAAAEVGPAAAEVEQRREAMNEAGAAAANLPDLQAMLAERRQRAAQISGDLAEFRAAKVERAQACARYREELAGMAARLEAGREAAAKIQALSVQVLQAEARERMCNTYEKAVGRDGLPQLLLELYAVPQLQELTNRFLAETEFRVAVTTSRDLQKGGQEIGVFISFTDSRGRFPLSAASGFQRVALGSALRCALAALHAASTGTRVWISIQDEGFGAYDENNLTSVRETLVKMAADRRWLFFISHVGGLSDIADTRISVVPGPETSTITVEGRAA